MHGAVGALVGDVPSVQARQLDRKAALPVLSDQPLSLPVVAAHAEVPVDQPRGAPMAPPTCRRAPERMGVRAALAGMLRPNLAAPAFQPRNVSIAVRAPPVIRARAN